MAPAANRVVPPEGAAVGPVGGYPRKVEDLEPTKGSTPRTTAASTQAAQEPPPDGWRDRSIFGPAMLLISGRFVAVAITFIVPLVLARLLAPPVFGTYRQLLLISTTIYGIAQLQTAECFLCCYARRRICQSK